jgi:hypothetical protein
MRKIKKVKKYLNRKIRRKPFKTFQRILEGSVKSLGIKISKVCFRNIYTLFLGILISGRSRLINTSEKLYSSNIVGANCAKSLENRLSYFFSKIARKKLKNINKVYEEQFFYNGLEEIRDSLWRFSGKKILVVDWTAYSKRARLNKKGRGMEHVGKVYDSREDGVVTGYGGFLGGLLLKDKNIFPLFHELYSNEYSFKEWRTLNDLEMGKIKGVKEKLGENILAMGDAYFFKKAHIYSCYQNGIDFLFRLKNDISIIDKGKSISLKEKIKIIKEEHKIVWENKENNKIKRVSGMAKFLKCITIFRSGKLKKFLPINVICVKVSKYKDPMYLITSLEVTDENIEEIVGLYNKRWAIEIFIENLKNNLGLEEFMVRKWDAIELICNIILSVYTVSLIILLTSGSVILNGIINLLRREIIIKKLTLTLSRLMYGFSLILVSQRQVKYA